MAARRPLLAAHMDQPVQERPGRDDQRPARQTVAILELESNDSPAVRQNPTSPGFDESHIWGCDQCVSDPRRVGVLVRLRTRRPDSRPAAAIQQLELNPSGVDRLAHQSAQRVDLAHQVALGGSADRWIAGHMPCGVARQRHERDVAAQSGGGARGLGAGMAGADDDDVERERAHFPIQNRSKICRRTSSLVLLPTISSSRSRACCRSAAMNSSGAAASAAVRGPGDAPRALRRARRRAARS